MTTIQMVIIGIPAVLGIIGLGLTFYCYKSGFFNTPTFEDCKEAQEGFVNFFKDYNFKKDNKIAKNI